MPLLVFHGRKPEPGCGRPAAQPEKAEVRLEIGQALVRYIDGLSDRGHFDAVQVAPGNSGEVPDEPGGVRLVVLGVAQPHNRRSDSYAMAEAKELLRQRGKTPRVYRNTLLFIAADARQLDSLGEAMRGSLAWRSILKDAGAGRLDLRESDKAFVQEQASSADQTLQIRLKEAWCYLICPEQESPQTEVEFFSTHVTAQDGVLSRASRKLAGDNVLLPEIGPQNLNVKLQKYIWQQKPHLLLQDLWKHLNSFAYAEAWDEENQCYLGLAIDNAGGTVVMLDDQALLVRADIAEQHRPRPDPASLPNGVQEPKIPLDGAGSQAPGLGKDEPRPKEPTRFIGTVMLSPERPARDLRRITEAVIEQITMLPDAEVTLKLEIDAEVGCGLDRAKVRTLLENASSLRFIDRKVE